MLRMSRYPVLFIDAYDSFTNNIISLLETELPVTVTKIHIDTPVQDLSAFLQSFLAIIVGPGPGSPENFKDIGLIADVWSLPDEDVLPVFGICLGFQSLVCAFGGRVARLPRPRHGIETVVTTSGTSIFEGFKELRSIQYHSLQAILPRHDSPGSGDFELLPLAWDFAQHGKGDFVDGHEYGILMAVWHTSKPFHGVQFHPESICSSPEAKSIVTKWWMLSLDWLKQHKPSLLIAFESSQSLDLDVSPPANSRSGSVVSSRESSPASGLTTLSTAPSSSSLLSLQDEASSAHRYYHTSIPVGNLSVPAVAEIFNTNKSETVILDSEKRQMPRLGVHSIVGLVERDTVKLNYCVGSRGVEIQQDINSTFKTFSPREDVLSYCKTFMEQNRVEDGWASLPFWGGLMGYINYEACLETINISSLPQRRGPDVSFAFIERSIVIAHEEAQIHIQSIKPHDEEWIHKTRDLLSNASQSQRMDIRNLPNATCPATCERQSESAYKSKIAECQEEISAGNSYELCLTNQATIKTQRLSGSASSWQRYLQLRNLNPAPFGAYLRLGPLTVLSSSPERFLSWTRPQSTSSSTPFDKSRRVVSKCQFRPIKGTVKKHQTTATGETRRVSLEEATAVLSTPKERAENLMIVDLIRHDLHGVVGSGNVEVSSLMAVEEYESVYQLVTVIEGNLETAPGVPKTSSDGSRSVSSGIDVLASSLPPGSMTGAPKKRACELLQGIEEEPRSVYSGVLGYMCVGGGGDFSVVIRTIYKWDEESNDGNEEWKIGAGGAITTLSNEDDEWEEMLTKMRSTLGVFGL